ncbi:hypothetical protein FC96_GL001874 [Secundilactobacillus kimchicus JCM 15530]|uniref:Integrase catalytic domain-containing protein n=1 Tax=Secundilactobacillus kimchicus JCM 15530 TaxID=1302272 RepID=A0A0R1HMS7_9LACO|nr:hypothetical protein FC96_GL001874 [Secundilactobacillus kimchicus JCM 15530]
MSRKATCLDNASIKSFFHILKVGTVHNHHFSTYAELKTVVEAFVYYYNHQRIKIKLAGMTPVECPKHSDQLSA